MPDVEQRMTPAATTPTGLWDWQQAVILKKSTRCFDEKNISGAPAQRNLEEFGALWF